MCNCKILFIIEGGNKLGFGHFARTSQIADYLKLKSDCEPVFVTENSVLCEKLSALNFNFFRVASLYPEEGQPYEISQIVNEEKPQQIVIDIKSDHDPSVIINQIRKETPNTKITLIDNVTQARLLADKNIYPVPSELIAELDWQDYKGKVCSGLKFFPLRKSFVEAKKERKQTKSIVVTMGGSDPNHLTISLMDYLVNIGRKVDIVIGSAFTNKKEIFEAAERCGDCYQIHQNPDNYEKILARSALAITALGITIYELAYLQIPTMVIGNYKSDLKTGRILETSGYCKFLGYHKDLRKMDFREAVLGADEKGSLSVPGRIQRPDGEGVEKLALAAMN